VLVLHARRGPGLAAQPAQRRGLTSFVAAAAALDPRPEISLTTNGIGLARLAGPLAAAGLDRLNVSLDTLSRPTFKELARVPAAAGRLSSAGFGDLDGDVGGFDGGDREHPWLQAEFVGGFAAEQ
jgi:hypothetical protein